LTSDFLPENYNRGLASKEWNKLLDKYITTTSMFSSEYEELGKEKIFSQEDLIQELKKCFKRLKRKQ